jgi:short-subunit dehydrogenase
MMDVRRYGPWALIIGGSEGVGAACAQILAAQNFNLVLVARKTAPLQALAEELRQHGTKVRIISADMSKPEAIDTLRVITDDIEIGFLFYNAGANDTRGNFVELDPDVYRRVIGINVIGQSECARHYGGLMRARGRGGIILTGSLAGYMGAPSLAAYCGAKAFSRIFSEALWAECAPLGIDVLHLVIGFTATPAMARLGFNLEKAQAPEQVAQEGLDNICNGPVWIVGGEANRQIAAKRSLIEGRAEAIGTISTPARTK